MNILVCSSQVPFIRGGAENLAEGLVGALKEFGHRADLIQVPYQWHPRTELLKSALAWRLLDLSSSNGVPIDRIITTKFPSYAARHRHKVVWLVHQLRQAYDWYATEFSDFTSSEDDLRVRKQIIELDRRMIGEANARYAISKNVAARLERFNGLTATPLYPPPRLAGRFREGDYGDYIFFIGRLDKAKRLDLVIRAMTEAKQARAIIAGDGPELDALRQLARKVGVEARVEFPGPVSDDTLLDLYAHARAVVYAPLDEDYGYVTVEAFNSSRPVITTSDAGGVLEFVTHEETGLVAEPNPESLGDCISRIYSEPKLRDWGRAGHERTIGITWKNVVEKLTG